MRNLGARVSIYAVAGVGGYAYCKADMKIVNYHDRNPTTAKEAMELWWEHKSMRACTVLSTLHRGLPSGVSHAQKVSDDIARRHKANVLLFPYEWQDSENKLAEFAHDVTTRMYDSDDWERNVKHLLNVVQGGVFYIEPVSEKRRIVQEPESHVNTAWAMIQAWLEETLPITGLSPWMRRDEYMELRQAKRKAQGL